MTNDQVVFTGYLNHDALRHLFPCCDVAVFPSLIPEAGPLVFYESLASGCVPLGTYFAAEEVKERCFERAYADVFAAFQEFLGRRDSGRGFALFGHSQGAQHVTRLLDEVVEEDASLEEDLVVALPIGWPVTVDSDQLTGGSLDQTPLCTLDDEYGCVVSYRAYSALRGMPDVCIGEAGGA